MTKRVLALLLCALTVLPLLAACDDTPPPPEHTHTYADAWSSSDGSHWKDATCGHEEKSEEGTHEFGDAKLTDGELVLAEGVFVGVSDEIEGAEPALLLKDMQSDKPIAVQGVPYGSFPDYGYNKGDLVRLFATVVCETYDSSNDESENKVCLQFSDQNPARADLTVRSCGNAVSYALDDVVELQSWNDVKSLFKPATLQAYT